MREPPHCHRCGQRLVSLFECLRTPRQRFAQRPLRETFAQMTRGYSGVESVICGNCEEPLSPANMTWWSSLNNDGKVERLA